jgi:hypothetical protein
VSIYGERKEGGKEIKERKEKKKKRNEKKREEKKVERKGLRKGKENDMNENYFLCSLYSLCRNLT